VRTAFLAAAWLVSRVLVVWLLLAPESWVNGDVSYFADSLGRAHVEGLAHTLVEYPLPAVGALALPWWGAALLGVGFGTVLMGTAVLTDLAFACLLWWYGGPRRDVALGTWVLAVPLLGATAYARFDLLPGVLAGVAVLLLARHPRVALAAAGVATGVKLWPALLLPGLLLGTRERRPVLAVLAGVAVALAGGTLALAGPARLVSPLTYAADRGLQIESVAAAPVMLLWWHDPGRWPVAYAASKSYEVTGPGVAVLLSLTTLATGLLVVALLGAWWWAWRRATVSADSVVWLSLAAVTGFVVTGKVLSPQYLLWLLPVAAAGLVLVRRTYAAALGWAAGLLLATLLTQLVFPGFYGGLTMRTGPVAVVVLLLVGRNVALVALAGVAWWQTVRCLRADAQRGSALVRQPPGPGCSGSRSRR
jgi:hypothetical protein